MRHYVALHPLTRKPEYLLRVDDGHVDVWRNREWTRTEIIGPQIEGLGGDSEYHPIPPADLRDWQDRLE